MRHSTFRFFWSSFLVLAVLLSSVSICAGQGLTWRFGKAYISDLLRIYPGGRIENKGFYRQTYSGTVADAFKIDYTGSGNYVANLLADGSPVMTLTKSGGLWVLGGVSASISIPDTDTSNFLTFDWGEDDTAGRVLDFRVVGADRILTVEGDSVINQDLTTDARPTFAGATFFDSEAYPYIEVGDSVSERGVFLWDSVNNLLKIEATTGFAALPVVIEGSYIALEEDDVEYVRLTGGNIGIGTPTPTAGLQMGDDKLIAVDTNAGLTASTTQAQGQGALTAQVNEISTVANDDDTITLPTATAGLTIEIINNGAKTLQIFPASGDNLGTGVDIATELETNESVQYVAYDATNWGKESTTEIIHAEAYDQDNTDAFVINDGGADFHAYHTNGLAAGDLAGWTFDAGGGGTSHAITAVADGTPSGTDISVTTGTVHGLAVGDIISQTNLADAAYVGIFEVKDITSTTVYEVAAVYTATGTGTMDQAATLDANTGSAGSYYISWWSSGTSATNNETFDFVIYKNATVAPGTKVRRKFGTANDFGSFAGGGIIDIGDGDKISFSLSNEDSAGNIIIRNLTIALLRL